MVAILAAIRVVAIAAILATLHLVIVTVDMGLRVKAVVMGAIAAVTEVIGRWQRALQRLQYCGKVPFVYHEGAPDSSASPNALANHEDHFASASHFVAGGRSQSGRDACYRVLRFFGRSTSGGNVTRSIHAL